MSQGEQVPERLTEPPKHWALDTDWVEAAFKAIFFLFLALAIYVGGRQLWMGAPVTTRITWSSVLSLAAFAWFAFAARVRAVRWACGLLSLSVASRILLVLTHASVATQNLNGEVMRAVDLMVYLGAWGYIVFDFKSRIKRV